MAFLYTDDIGRRASLEEAMATSACYFALCTRNYLEDIKNKDRRILAEIEMAKRCNTPAILFLFDNLTSQEEKEILEVFKDHNIIKTYKNIPYKPESAIKAKLDASEIRNILDKLEK